jgi:hypothetical protein
VVHETIHVKLITGQEKKFNFLKTGHKTNWLGWSRSDRSQKPQDPLKNLFICFKSKDFPSVIGKNERSDQTTCALYMSNQLELLNSKGNLLSIIRYVCGTF